MENLRKIRNGVEDICFKQIPDSILSETERIELQKKYAREVLVGLEHLAEFVDDKAPIVYRLSEQVSLALGSLAMLQEHSAMYFEIEMEIIPPLFSFLFSNPHIAFKDIPRVLDFVNGLREAIEHQRRRESPCCIPAVVAWRPVMDTIVTLYSETSRDGYLCGWSASTRIDIISNLLKLLKEIVHFQRPADLIEFVLCELLQPLDLLQQSAPDTVELAFTIIGQFGGDDLVPYLSRIFEEFLDKRQPDIDMATWFSPRLELNMLTILAKLDPRHLSKLPESMFPRIKVLLSLGLEWIGIPSSASNPSGTVPSVETAGLHKQPGTLSGVERRRIAGKVSRLAVACMWTSDSEAVALMGWKFVELFSIRTQTIILPSVGMVGKDEDGGRWPYRMSEVYTSLVHHWLRRKTKHDFLSAPVCGADHDRFVQLLLPGISNIVKNAMAGGSGATIATRYISVYANLVRIGSRGCEEMDIGIETLEDEHKAMIHSIVLMSRFTPLSGQLANDLPSPHLMYLLDYSVAALNPTNLVKTVAALGFLDVVLTQTPHRWTLRDLSDCSSTDNLPEVSSRLLMTSTAFPDWSCRFLQGLLGIAPDLPKGNSSGTSSLIVSALSSEGMEMMARTLVKDVWRWIVANVDQDTTLGRLFVIIEDFIAANWSSLTAEIDRLSLIGSLVGITMAQKFNRNVFDSFLNRVNSSDLKSRGNKVWLTLLCQSIRNASPTLAVEYRPKIQSIVIQFLSDSTCGVPLKKLAIKLARRLAESMCRIVIHDNCNFGKTQFSDSLFLLNTVSRSPTDVESYWWSPQIQSVQMHVANEYAAAEDLFTSLLSSGNSTDLQLRLIGAYGKSTSRVHPHSATVLVNFDPATCSDLKTTSLWLKACRFLFPQSQDESRSDESEGIGMIMREISGFKIENLLQFGYIGKEFESLDSTRAEYIRTRLEELLSNMIDLRSGERAIPDDHWTVLRHITSIVVIKSPFEKLKVSGLVVLKNLSDFWATSNLDNRDRLVDLIYKCCLEAMDAGRRSLNKHEASGIGFLFNFIGELRNMLAISREKMVGIFTRIQQQISVSNIESEAMESMLGIVRDQFNQRRRSSVHTTTKDEDSDTMMFLGSVRENPAMYWKAQVGNLVLAYTLWRQEPSVGITRWLIEILARGNLASCVRDMVVFWLQMLILVGGDQVRSLMSLGDAVRVAKSFSVCQRFEGKSGGGPSDSAESIVRDVIATDLNVYMFTSSRIPRITNRGLKERHVAFWDSLFQGNAVSFSPIDLVEALVSWSKESETDDDVHCTVFELIAAVLPRIDITTSLVRSYLVAQIARGDGSLIPTIGAAIRQGIVGLGISSLVPSPDRVSTKKEVEQVFKFLWSEIEALPDESSSLMKTRLLVVLNNSVLIDLSMFEFLDQSGLRSYFFKDLWNESTTEQIRDLAAGVLARMCRIEGPSGPTESALANVVVNEIQSDQLKVTVLQLLARIIKFRRSLPSYVLPYIVRIALSCVASHRDDIKGNGTRFLELLARFVSVDEARQIAVDQAQSSPKEIEAIVRVVANALVNSVTRENSPMWHLSSHTCIELKFVLPLKETLFVNLGLNELSNPICLEAAGEALSDLLVIKASGDGSDQAALVPQLLHLAAMTSIASLYYDVPKWGIEAVGRLALVLTRQDASPTIKRIGQNAIADFLKTQTDRGTREKTEKLFDSDILSLVRSSKSKHSYIS